ncbi:MAG: acyltransferase family protein [Chloroflexi bacterium]|nr:acyltransferase family protein [Chloroflexota bacterium]
MTTLENVFTPPTADSQESTQIAPAQAIPAVRTEEQVVYVKVVRAFAMLVIVTFHVTFPLIYLYNSISYGDWWIANNFYIWGKIGSPLFTMVSGMLLLNPSKDQPILVFFKKRFTKVLFPFVAWSVIYLLWRIFIRGDAFTLKQALLLLVEGPVYYHLWFIQMILGLYLATPILRIYIRHAKRENLTYFLLVWLVTDSLLPVIKRFLGVTIGIDVVVTTGYVGFFVMGYYLRNITLTRRQLIPVLLTIVTMLGVYFVHVVIIEELAGGRLGFTLNAASFYPLLSIPTISVLAMALSVGATMLLRRIPFVRNIVP